MSTLTAALVDLALDDAAFARFLTEPTAGPEPEDPDEPREPGTPREPDGPVEPVIVFVVPA